MDTKETPKYRHPKIGLRNIKTALAATLCALVYYFFDRSPAVACIGAIFGMGSDYGMSKLHGGNRFFGTLVGGFIGMGLFAFYVLGIIIFNPPIDTYISYALNRILDTGIGVLAALFVNGMLPGGFTFGFMHRLYVRLGIKDDVEYVERKSKSSEEETQK